MKFNIGDKLHISGDIEITGEQSQNNGSYSYNTNTGVTFPAYALEKLVCTAASVKPQDKPRFKAGDKAKVIGNTCDHASKLGDIVTLENPYVPTAVEDSPAWDIKEDPYEYISERDLEPYAEPARPTAPAKEPKPEPKPSKLYCVKSDTPGEWVTKGKIYEAAERGSIIFDNGWKSNYDFREGVPEEWKNNLVPLVSRPAKAGEWVLVNHISGDSGGISVGDIALVVMVNNGCGPYIRSKEKTIFGYNELGNVTLLKDDWCEVLDGYDGRYEQTEPKYLSGKVVCVETHDDFTVGKVYTFKDGKVTDDSWRRRPMSSFVAESLEDWNSRCGDCIVRFVEYKGEA